VTQGFTYPGSHNAFVPDYEASGKLRVEFSRNVKDFAVNSYCQIQPCPKPVGFYLNVTVEEAGRILDTVGGRFRWPDGAEAPSGEDGTESFQFLPFRCERQAYPVWLGDMTVENASWDIRAQHSNIKAQQAMTWRTQVAATSLQTSSNWAATHTSAVSAISGNTGTWTASTTARQDIKRSINTASIQIVKDTLSAVKVNDLILVLSPDDASNISLSQEIVDHIKGSPEALAQVRGELPGRNVGWGLPNKIYGMPIVVEQTVKVTSRKGASKVTAFVWSDGEPVMCARPGGLEGLYGAPTFSTFVFFMQEEMTTEWFEDARNRRNEGRVVETFAGVLVASVSGYLFTSAT
jgi:hypothetical protein